MKFQISGKIWAKLVQSMSQLEFFSETTCKLVHYTHGSAFSAVYAANPFDDTVSWYIELAIDTISWPHTIRYIDISKIDTDP